MMRLADTSTCAIDPALEGTFLARRLVGDGTWISEDFLELTGDSFNFDNDDVQPIAIAGGYVLRALPGSLDPPEQWLVPERETEYTLHIATRRGCISRRLFS